MSDLTPQYTIRIDCVNAAFGDDEHDRRAEVARILRTLADHIADGADDCRLFDLCGNPVGRCTFTDPETDI